MDKLNFKYKGISFVVFYINKQINIYKLVNSNYVALNDKEREMVNKLLNNQYSYVYDSELLLSLINQNSKIENKEYLYNFLSWLENIIPLECRDNFYRNISTLSTELST
jgi:hypothetical protein